MFILLLIFIFVRPFICSRAWEDINFVYSGALSLLLLAWILTKNGLPKTTKPIATALLLFGSGLILSLSCSANKLSGAMTLSQYINGFLLLLICQNLSLEHKGKIVLGLIATGTCVSLMAIYQYFFGFQDMLNYLADQHIHDMVAQTFIRERRVFTPFISPNTLGTYLIMIIPLTFSVEKYRWVTLLLIVALVLTKSLGAIFSLCLALLFYYLWHKEIKMHVLWALICLLTTTIVMAFLRAQNSVWHHPFFSAHMRWDYWMETCRIIKENPWVGIGLGNFDLINSRFTHNSYLQLWAEAGPLTLIGFLFLIVTMLRYGLTAIKNETQPLFITGAFISICAFLMHNLIDFSLVLPETGLLAAVIAGLWLTPPKPCPPSAA